MTPATGTIYLCTPGGAIAVGHRRLAGLLTALAALSLLAAVIAWTSGRLFPGFLALSVAAVVGLAWRMSQDLRPRRLCLEDQTMWIETTSRRIPVPIAEATVRRLDDEEIQHLEILASAGGFVVGSGGFDSRRLGEFDLYGSDFANALLIEGLEGRVVVTPDQAVEFVGAFEKQAASPLLQSRGHE